MKRVFGYEYEPAAHFLVTDEDAADFLQSQFSNELRPFAVGQCTYGLWLNVKGKVVADSVILCEGDERFRILSEHSPFELIAQKLEQHIIADDVEIEQLSNGAAIALVGSGASAALEALSFPVPANERFVETSGLYFYRGRRSTEMSVELYSESTERVAEIRQRLVESGVEFISKPQVELHRIAAGIPSVPIEIGSTDLPGEGALVGHGVSLTKGCYLGQEVVSRMYNLGRPQRALFRVAGLGTVPACPIVLYNADSKKVGELRSAYLTATGWQGVALLKKRYAEVGHSLSYSTGSLEIEAVFIATSEGGK